VVTISVFTATALIAVVTVHIVAVTIKFVVGNSTYVDTLIYSTVLADSIHRIRVKFTL